MGTLVGLRVSVDYSVAVLPVKHLQKCVPICYRGYDFEYTHTIYSYFTTPGTTQIPALEATGRMEGMTQPIVSRGPGSLIDLPLQA